jgi:hypothetical protein
LTITQNGNTLTWTGQVTLTNATNITTGVATLMLTPNGGVGNLPVLASGPSGPPPVIDSVSVTQIAYSASPSAPVWTLVSSGGPGVASHYTLSFEVNEGSPGSAGSYELQNATDLTAGTAAVGSVLAVNSLSPITFGYVAQPAGNAYQSVSFTAASGNSSPQTLATLTVPAQPFNWLPDCVGWAIPSGTANTHVDLRVLLNNPTSGQQVAYGYGITGAGTTWPALPVPLLPAFGGAITGGYGQVNAGSAASFYFQCLQTASTTDSFSVPTTSMYFKVNVIQVP